MSDLKQLSALTSLNAMMEKSYFSISTVDSVGDMLGINPQKSEAYRIPHPLHCIDWSAMPKELRDAIPCLIQECLGVAPAFKFKTAQAEVIELQPPSKNRNILQRIGRIS